MLQTLELTQFRSYDNGLFGFEPGVNIIVGPNASGKTNLLEAIHVISRMSGFKSGDKDLIRIGEQWSRLEALTDEGVRVVKLKENEPKLLELDGVVKKRLSLQTGLPVVIFEPEHMLMLGSEPERRRAYLDGILSLIRPSYRQDLLAYRRTLSQRNRLLKQSISSNQLFVWDIQLAERAGVIVSARMELTNTLNDVCGNHYRAISQHDDSLLLGYSSKCSLQNYSDDVLRRLRDNHDVDMQRGFTTVGPHRDDLYIELNGHDARVTASRGETRSIILALKIAELELLREHAGKRPILLLDDVFSELDGTRRRALAEALKQYQTFLTTTDADVAVDHFSDYNIIPMS